MRKREREEERERGRERERDCVYVRERLYNRVLKPVVIFITEWISLWIKNIIVVIYVWIRFVYT